jgi:branched-chain amino acid transport system substrate-binding protein
MRGVRSAFAVVVMLVGVLACLGSAAAETIRIGLLVPVSGNVARWGGYAMNGAKLSAEEINAAGGVLGRQIELFSGDSQCQPAQGVSALRRLVSADHVSFVLGDICSSVTLAAMPVAAENKVILLNAASSHPDITYKAGVGGNPWVFRNWPTDELRTKIVTEYVAKEGAKKYAILNSDNDFGRGAAALSKQHVSRLGGTVVSEDYFKDGETDFQPVLTKLRGLKPDVLLIYGAPDVIPPLTAQMRAIGVKVRLAGSAEMVSPDILKKASTEVLEGAVEGQVWDAALGGERNAAFVRAYKAKYGDAPQLHAFSHWETLKLLVKAIEKAGSPDPEKVRTALAGIEYDGVIGKIRFDDHNQVEVPMALIQVEGGKAVIKGTFTTKIQYPSR